MYEENREPVGHINFKIDPASSVAEWGFYIRPGAERGTGRRMGSAALDFAFHDQKLHKVVGQVLDYNVASKKMHCSLGFTQEGVLREHVLIENRRCDLFCYGILAYEWSGINQDGNVNVQ